jgi:hypothetical protein
MPEYDSVVRKDSFYGRLKQKMRNFLKRVVTVLG